MKLRVGIIVLAAVILAGPAFAQTQGQTAPPKPTTPTAPAPQAPAPVPFPEGAKIAYVDFQAIASQSELGKAATQKINDLAKKKQQEGQDKNKALQAMLDKQKTQASVLSDAAMKQLESDIAKAQRDLQYFQNEAQAEVEALNNELMRDFQTKVMPIVQDIAKERGLHMVLAAAPELIVFANRGLDLTPDVIKRANETLKK